MEGLRDSWLMKNSPTEVDLRENKMSLFDTTILENMMNEQSTKMTKVEEGFYFLFSKNPWRCGCKRIKHIQEFLAKYQFLLKDGDEMECSNLPVTVINFNYKTECEPADHHQLMV
ncbi:protein singed wings 2 [Eurytemora carolleeae]|uniref:protein singed wings 2 n=1 Tax=Eurytemora carolleeae TaxID=1294199 RepID=UPI000C761423|nr:protein singed wings 2 [Eurytemora carolleeae]|eukprot:XP_023333126.1 protein singed wings 2-like [Eurytemora affinis]